MGFIIVMVSSLLLLWGMSFICMRGCSWILISGTNMLSKEEKQTFREKHDIVAMNRYIGKIIFLPLALYLTAIFFITEYEPAWADSTWFFSVNIISVLVVLGFCFYGVSQVLGRRFERK
jgi:hypothetical protein